MRFIENAAFDEINQKRLLLDFYDFFYYVDVDARKVIDVPSWQETIAFWLKDIVVAINQLDLLSKSELCETEVIFAIDYTTTLYAKLSCITDGFDGWEGVEYKTYIESLEEFFTGLSDGREDIKLSIKIEEL